MSLTINQSKAGPVTVAYCVGRITQGESSMCLHHFARGVLSNGNKLILELSEVTYIDSSGIGELGAIWMTFRNAGGDLLIANPGGKVKGLLATTKFDSIVRVVATVEDGLQKLDPRGALENDEAL